MRRLPLWPATIGIVTMVILGLFLLFVLRNVAEMRVLRGHTFSVEHALEVQRTLDAVLIAEAEADSAVRAFLMSGVPTLLEEFRAEQRTSSGHVQTLRALTADSPSQSARVARLEQAIAARRDAVALVLAAREKGGLDAALDEARTARTTGMRGDVRSIIAELETEEARLLAERRTMADDAYRRAVGGRVGSGVVSGVLLIAIVLIAGLHARSKIQREEALLRSERRAVEAAAREQEARAEAERANHDKDQFLAVLSHELRTPLNAVLGWTQILQAPGQDAATIARAVASIRRNAESQQRLVEDLLDVSRIVAGKLPVEREPFDMRSAVAAAVEAVRPSATAKGLTLETQLDETPVALGDGGRIQQVAANLLSNAVKFTPPDGSIAVRLTKLEREALLEVRDNGAGIPEDLLPHVFERFRQGDSGMTRLHGGLGLGLTIARHIVDAHGGTLTVQSDGPDRGASFQVRLPYA